MQSPPEKPFLEEQGVRITKTHLTVPGYTIEFRKILSISLHPKPASLLEKLMHRATFQLMISTNAVRTPVSVFETQDTVFMERIQLAMNKAAHAAGATTDRRDL
jgi:hypothetical protein